MTPAQLLIASDSPPLEATIAALPNILLQHAVLELGPPVAEGAMVKAVTPTWFALATIIERDPTFLYTVPWRKLEEIIAGAYERQGWTDVILTPRSRDGGRDIIATWPGVCRVRIIDQVKCYAPSRVVDANEVRALLGVLSSDLGASKGYVTTTATFAPGIKNDPSIRPFMPTRLELRDGQACRDWLTDVAHKKRGSRNCR